MNAETAPLSEDKDKSPIDPHEEFRRSKRNSLFWSSISILSIAAMPDHYLAKFHLGIARLDLEAWWVLIGLTVTTVFMLAGFERSRRYLRLRHSATIFERKSGDAVKKIDEIIEDLKETSKLTAEGKARSEYLISMLDDGEQQAKRLHEDMKKQTLKDSQSFANEARQSIENSSEFNDTLFNCYEYEQGDAEKLANIINKERLRCMQFGFSRGHFQAGNAMNILDRITRFLEHKGEYQPQSDNESLNTSISKLDQLSADLSKFHSNIDGTDKAWHNLHDRGAVYVLFSIAMVMASVQTSQFAESRDLAPSEFETSIAYDGHQ